MRSIISVSISFQNEFIAPALMRQCCLSSGIEFLGASSPMDDSLFRCTASSVMPNAVPHRADDSKNGLIYCVSSSSLMFLDRMMKSLKLTKHRVTRILLHCSQLILNHPSSCVTPELLCSVRCSQYLLGRTLLCAHQLPVLALPPPLKDTKSVVETCDIAEFSDGEFWTVARERFLSCKRLLNQTMIVCPCCQLWAHN